MARMIAAVILAAGASTRFGSPKQRILLAPVLERVRAAVSVDDAAVVVLADGPELAPEAIDRVVAAWRGEPVLAAGYGGVRGHPVLLARAAWEAVPDDGARALE